MKTRLTLACIAAAMISVVASAAVPNIFVAGQPASASQVNQNFQYLDQRTNGAIGTLVTTGISASSDTSTSVAAATCSSNSIVLSANCDCSNAGGTRNLGILFACNVAGNSGVVGCFVDTSFNPNLPLPRGDVTVVCLSGLQVDGTPLFVSHAAKAKQATNELETKLNELRQMELDHAAAIKT